MGGAAPSKTFNPVNDLPPMAGKVVLITGSSRGIGFASLQYFSRLGATVYMATSNEERAKEAIERAEKAGLDPGKGQIIWHALDLKDPRDAKASAESFMKKEKRLDILINNAGLLAGTGKPTFNVDGVIDTMAVNYLGPYVFTRTLLPLLESTAADGNDVRIVTMGSSGHAEVSYSNFSSKQAWNHLFKWSLLPGLERYKYSKLAVHVWTNNLSKRLEAEKSRVMVLLAHPGAILSDGAIQNVKALPFPSLWMKLLGTMLYPQERGAFTAVFAACAPRDDPQIKHGAYIVTPNVASTQAPIAMDQTRQQQLFECTEALLKDIGI